MVLHAVSWLFSLGPMLLVVPIGIGGGLTLALAPQLRNIRLAHIFFGFAWIWAYGCVLEEIMNSRIPLKYSVPTTFLITGMIGVLALLSHYWVEGNRREYSSVQDGQTRQGLYVTLSSQQTEGINLYGTEFFTVMQFLAADAEANNKHLTEAQRREKGDEGKKQLAALNALRDGAIAQYQTELADTVARIRMAFPKDSELDRLLNNATIRPMCDVGEPHCDTLDHACMQKWADAEAKKAEKASTDFKQRIAALLAYIDNHLGA